MKVRLTGILAPWRYGHGDARRGPGATGDITGKVPTTPARYAGVTVTLSGANLIRPDCQHERDWHYQFPRLPIGTYQLRLISGFQT